MAHLVKCLYCGQQFDADKIAYVKPNNTRYAHKTCAEQNANKNTSQGIYQMKKATDGSEDAHRLFFDCIRDVTKGKCEVDWGIVTREEKRLVKAGYTLSGLTKTFYYVYEIMHHPLPEKITLLYDIERYYETASEYYRNVFLVNKRNKEKYNENAVTQLVETTVKSSKPHIKFFDIGE